MRGISYYPHHLLLRDRTRTLAFAQAIRELAPGRVVADLGAGSGVLSILAAKAGAERVVAVELVEDMARFVRTLAERNGCGKQIEVACCNGLDLAMRSFADLLVCDAMGFFGASEEMEVMLQVRDRWLRPGGRVLPAAVELVAVPVSVLQVHDWLAVSEGSLYGIDLDLAKELSFNTLHSVVLEPKDYLSAPQIVQEIDLRTADDCTTAFRSTWTARQAGSLHGLGGWYGARLVDTVRLTNDPQDWRPMARARLFPLESPRRVQEGDRIEFEIASSPVLAFWSCRITRNGELLSESHQTDLDKDDQQALAARGLMPEGDRRAQMQRDLLAADLVARRMMSLEDGLHRVGAQLSAQDFEWLSQLMDRNSRTHGAGVFAGLV